MENLLKSQVNKRKPSLNASLLFIASTISFISVVSFFIWLNPATVCIATNWSSSICDTIRGWSCQHYYFTILFIATVIHYTYKATEHKPLHVSNSRHYMLHSKYNIWTYTNSCHSVDYPYKYNKISLVMISHSTG